MAGSLLLLLLLLLGKWPFCFAIYIVVAVVGFMALVSFQGRH